MTMPSSMIVRATVRYIGTPFAGWQVQPDRPTVQGEIEKVLSEIANGPVRIHGAGRTDTGVHAIGQVCSFPWKAGADLDSLRRSLTRMLAPHIQISSLTEAPHDFHARKSAVGKKYWYCVSTARDPDPFSAPFTWTLPFGTDLDRLRALCARFAGTRDFAGFQCSGSEREDTVRRLIALDVSEGGIVVPSDARGLFAIRFHGDGFLYKMVRNITGTLVDVARGAVPESRIDELLASPGPYRGYTAPAHGLTLIEVLYA
ncbi:MAG: tRNA pseudouridine(38-40) synthase TruA [Candidatus Hydrogenedentes bacterium]|nr:tRNA pseudouridine(38-40) synthase TruA [Candidatus Hydrogenedentota bacterium]